MQESKKNIIYASAIIVLVIALGVIWFFLIKTINSTNTSNQSGGAMNQSSSSSVTYSSIKEITADEEITGGKFTSTNAGFRRHHRQPLEYYRH